MQEPTIPLKQTWVFWENLKNVEQKQNQGHDEFLANNKVVMSVKDLNTFAQFWNNTYFSTPSKIFQDLDCNIAKFQKEETKRQIECLAIFRDGIKPAWEDPKNKTGFEFRYIQLVNDEEQIQLIERIWNDFVISIISDETPEAAKYINGIRIADKSTGRKPLKIRFEIWLSIKYCDDKEQIENCDKARDFLTSIIAKNTGMSDKDINSGYTITPH